MDTPTTVSSDAEKKFGLMVAVILAVFSVAIAVSAFKLIRQGSEDCIVIKIPPLENGKCGTHQDSVATQRKFGEENPGRTISKWDPQVRNSCFESAEVCHRPAEKGEKPDKRGGP